MRPRILGLFILLHSSAAFAGSVIVEPPLMRVVSTREQLHERCGAEGNFDACARFIAFRLRAQCSMRDGIWTLTGSATFRPWITLYNIRQLPHEQEHIRDVRALVASHIAELEAIAFADEQSCHIAADLAGGTFGDKMAEFAAASNQRMHHRPTKPLVTGTRRPASAVATSIATSGFTSASGRR
jgi:hypothetical protein